MHSDSDMNIDIDAVHDFWFGPLDTSGMAAPQQHALWFTKSEKTDLHCAENFGGLVRRALAGELAHWRESPRGRVALVLLLDQFTRNIYRGSAEAFAGDPQARALSLQTLAAGQHRSWPAIHQVFLFMPLEHSEDLALQEQCVALFEQLAADTGIAQIVDFGRYAQAHRAVIEQFGRFPHRNAALGRLNTAAEAAYLATNSGF
ncbi:MAG: DUF924 family protein [Pseudomonadota bacterium]